MGKLLEQQMGQILSARGLTLSAAESCTGGLVSSRITDISGSSDYFMGGIVSYSNVVKMSALKVSPATLRAYGAVSRETVLEMARGARLLLKTDIAFSVSGIAGPSGGTERKPVGTVWLALSAAEGEWARLFLFDGDRLQIKSHAADAALQFVLDFLNENLPAPEVPPEA